jgi:hypothetical protein
LRSIPPPRASHLFHRYFCERVNTDSLTHTERIEQYGQV